MNMAALLVITSAGWKSPMMMAATAGGTWDTTAVTTTMMPTVFARGPRLAEATDAVAVTDAVTWPTMTVTTRLGTAADDDARNLGEMTAEAELGVAMNQMTPTTMAARAGALTIIVLLLPSLSDVVDAPADGLEPLGTPRGEV